MKLRLSYFSILLLIGIFSSCSGPQKLYEKGNYFKAFDKALSKLKNDKDRKMKTLLNKSFAKMIDKTRDDLIDVDRHFNIVDVEANLIKYEKVEERFEDGKLFLTEENINKHSALGREKDALVSIIYDEGLDYMDDYDSTQRKISAREAYAYFSLVDRYCNADYPDMDQLLYESLEAGTVVYNVNADLNFDQSYRWEVNRKFDDLEGQQGFVRIVYDRQGNVGDCLVELDFDSLDEEIRESTSTKSYSKEIEDGYTTSVDTSGKEIKTVNYKTITGSVITNRLTKKIRWRLNLDVRSMNADCNLREERFSEELVDVVDQHEIEGDERAIPSQFISNNNEELESTDDMVDDLIDKLYRDIYNYLY